jgi:hypothetical protein
MLVANQILIYTAAVAAALFSTLKIRPRAVEVPVKANR